MKIVPNISVRCATSLIQIHHKKTGSSVLSVLYGVMNCVQVKLYMVFTFVSNVLVNFNFLLNKLNMVPVFVMNVFIVVFSHSIKVKINFYNECFDYIFHFIQDIVDRVLVL